MPSDAALSAVSEFPAVEVSSQPNKRDALMRAALDLFAERTYGSTPVPDIAARAHVGTGTVYRHFQSKEDLANYVYRACKTTLHDGLRDALSRGGSVEEKFLRMWQSMAKMAASDPKAMRFIELQHHEEYLDDASRALSDAVFDTAEQFMREGQKQGHIREADPRVLIALVFGAFVGLFKEACLGRYELDDARVRDAAAMAWRIVAP
jgi:TetR/AcrR family transcriptional regulator, repressor of fatR-cypB operon